jgi:hypothetical protein
MQTPVTDELLLEIFERALFTSSHTNTSNQLYIPTVKTTTYSLPIQSNSYPIDSFLQLPCPSICSLENTVPHQFLKVRVNSNMWSVYLTQKLSY